MGAANYKPSALELIQRASKVNGLSEVDLNFPDHFAGTTPEGIISAARDLGLTVNGLAMRYYSEPEFKLGAFTNPDRAFARAQSISPRERWTFSNKRGAICLQFGSAKTVGDPFQVDYETLWKAETEGIREVADHNPRINVSIEYKPNEPRSFSLLSNLGITLLAIKEIDRPNLGVTFDFAHVLYAGELPAFAAAMIARESQLLGIHLNDGYGRRDDGLMVGTVNFMQTLEVLFQLMRKGFDGVIYFDTFPDVSGLDPVRECENNIAMVNALWELAKGLTGQPDLLEAIGRQDAVASQDIVRRAIFGHKGPEAS